MEGAKQPEGITNIRNLRSGVQPPQNKKKRKNAKEKKHGIHEN